MLRRPKDKHHIILNTTAFALSADIHLEPGRNLLDHLQQTSEFLSLTRVSAVTVASISEAPQTIQQGFALINPASVVSFSIREEGSQT
jgi:hypothetical protein